ncbi:hypothetical protein MMC07_005978 [Pseudocyphellaria aurata]|nr:hypothetical protein [Pseudocyphellaria aurata]
MPQPLSASDIDSKTDPTVSVQFDNETPKDQQVQDFYKTVDSLKTSLLTTIRSGVGPVARSMAVAKRVGPDFLFIANKHSRKFEDIENSKEALVTFQNSSTQDWVSITGTITVASNDDPRIKELYNPALSAWFGDLGDGVHTGKAEDPRMALIEVKSKYISYWNSKVTSLGFLKEVGLAALTGKVADTGIQRELLEKDIEAARQESS